MKSKTLEEKLLDWQAKNPGIPEDADLRVMAALLRAKPPTKPSTRKLYEQERKRIQDTPGLMDNLREMGLLD